MKLEKPTRVQMAAIPQVMTKRDVYEGKAIGFSVILSLFAFLFQAY